MTRRRQRSCCCRCVARTVDVSRSRDLQKSWFAVTTRSRFGAVTLATALVALDLRDIQELEQLAQDVSEIIEGCRGLTPVGHLYFGGFEVWSDSLQ